MGEPATIGVDLGGTHIKIGACDAEGVLRCRSRLDTNADRPAEQIAETILHAVRDCEETAERNGLSITAVGVVMPGLLNEDRSVVEFVANVPTLNGFALPRHLADQLAHPVVLDADSNGAAWGEYRFGAGRGCGRLMMVSAGTGIGVGVVLDGAIVRTTRGTAGSLGHIIVDADGPRCACGACGCLERLAGPRGLNDEAQRQAAERPDSALASLVHRHGKIGGTELARALADGDTAAMAVVRQCGRWLGVGLASLAAAFSPKRVVLGGGLSQLGKPLLFAAEEAMHDVGGPPFVKSVELVLCELGTDAGVIGAAALAQEGVR